MAFYFTVFLVTLMTCCCAASQTAHACTQIVPDPAHNAHVSNNCSAPPFTPAELRPECLLLNAVECGSSKLGFKLVEVLCQCGIAHGLDLELVSARGETALHAAVRNNDAKVRTVTACVVA